MTATSGTRCGQNKEEPLQLCSGSSLFILGEGQVAVLHPAQLAAHLVDGRSQDGGEDEANQNQAQPVESSRGDGGGALGDGLLTGGQPARPDADLTAQADTILQEARESTGRAESLVKVMEGIDKSGRDVAAETESVSAATEEQSASMDEVACASRKLSDLAQELSSSTAKFRI